MQTSEGSQLQPGQFSGDINNWKTGPLEPVDMAWLDKATFANGLTGLNMPVPDARALKNCTPRTARVPCWERSDTEFAMSFTP